MKYLLFAGDCYYANGGAFDFIDASDELEKLKERGRSVIDKEEHEWFHVFNVVDRRIEYGTVRQAYGIGRVDGGYETEW